MPLSRLSALEERAGAGPVRPVQPSLGDECTSRYEQLILILSRDQLSAGRRLAGEAGEWCARRREVVRAEELGEVRLHVCRGTRPCLGDGAEALLCALVRLHLPGTWPTEADW